MSGVDLANSDISDLITLSVLPDLWRYFIISWGVSDMSVLLLSPTHDLAECYGSPADLSSFDIRQTGAYPGKGNDMTSTVRKDRLARLGTAALIEQYELATSTYRGRLSNHSPRQVRINYIVDMISKRADGGDPTALAWLA